MKAKVKRQKAKMVIVLLILISTPVYSQTYEELQDIFFYTSKKLDEARDSIKILNSIKARQDIIIVNHKKVLQKDSVLLMNCEQQVEVLKVEAAKIELPAVIKWKGLYPGLSIAYPFNDSVLTKQTFFDGLKYDLTASFKFEVIGKLDVSGIVGIPLRKEKFYIKIQTDWKVF